MRVQNKIVLSFAVALMMTSPASAQRRTPPARPAEVGVAIRLVVAGQRYQFEGKAACQHAPIASIYGVRAEMWGVQQSDGQRSITLTLWRPKNTSGDMFSLSVATGAKSYVVNTVTASGESAVQGSGKVTFTTSGAGGTFMINAKAPNGAAITGTIQCSAFTHAMAEGG
jgi:hypothetical protein